MNQNKQRSIPTTLKNFGLEYCFQGIFTDPIEMEQVKARWQKIGHKAMVKNGTRLYVTRFPQ